MKLKCCIFDLDDTLVDNTENIRGAFQYLLSYLGLSYTEEDFQKWMIFDHDYWSKGIYQTISIPEEYNKTKELFTEYVRSMRFSFFFKELQQSPFILNQVYNEGLLKRIVPLNNARETLTFLSLKYPIYIATNGESNAAKEKIERIGLSHIVKGIFSADMTEHTVTKANPEYYQELLLFLKDYQPSDCIIIGDHYRDDVLIPHQLGFHTCFLHNTKPVDFVGDYHITQLCELENIL